MNGVAGSPGADPRAAPNATGFDEAALMQGAGSIAHPLTQALLALTFTTGLVDAASYLGLGRVFTANMTGNVVLLGFGVARSGGLPVLAPICSLAAFVLGSVVGGVLVTRLDKRHPALVARALVIEVGLVGASAILAGVEKIRPGDAAAYVVIVLLAFAMGVRSTAVRRIGVPDLSTVVLTMTLSALASGSRLAGGSGAGTVRRLAAVVAMFAGALSGALLLKVSLFVPLALATAMALLTWLVYVPIAVRRGSASL
jgi:uncharacterized membrane protein YoaK (UPF0700 family)